MFRNSRDRLGVFIVKFKEPTLLFDAQKIFSQNEWLLKHNKALKCPYTRNILLVLLVYIIVYALPPCEILFSSLNMPLIFIIKEHNKYILTDLRNIKYVQFKNIFCIIISPSLSMWKFSIVFNKTFELHGS